MKFYITDTSSFGDRVFYLDDLKEFLSKYKKKLLAIPQLDMKLEKLNPDDYTFGDVEIYDIVVEVPNLETIIEIVKTVDEEVVISEGDRDEEKYPTLIIYDGYLE